MLDQFADAANQSLFISGKSLKTSMKAIRVHECGSPDVLRYEEVPKPELTDESVILKLGAIGVNFTDVYVRSGLYKTQLPITPGQEAAGVVTAIGPKTRGLKEGDAVVYTGVLGAYAQYALVPAWRLVKLPLWLDLKTAAAVFLQGMTAHYLCHDTFSIRKGHKVLIHAGAGGVGLLLIQMAKQLGAYVITTTSTEEKAALTREVGADHVIIYTKQDFEDEVRRLTDGSGVNVVYDSVGKTTFEKSMKCLARRGMMVVFGQSSGLVRPVSLAELQSGSFFLTRPMLGDYTSTRGELEHRAKALFAMVKSGKLKARIFKTMALSRAADAHRLLETRRTTGKLLLIPPSAAS